MISYLGAGLNITILCDHVLGHNWMSFLCWYSIHNNLPDSKVNILCKRNNVTGSLFLWTKKLNVPFRMCSDSIVDKLIKSQPAPSLIIPPYCMALRDFEEAKYDVSSIKNEVLFVEGTNLICDATADEFSVFCSYKEGWGHFILNNWINKSECPLSAYIVKKFNKQNMSFNEKRIESLWNSELDAIKW